MYLVVGLSNCLMTNRVNKISKRGEDKIYKVMSHRKETEHSTLKIPS